MRYITQKVLCTVMPRGRGKQTGSGIGGRRTWGDWVNSRPVNPLSEMNGLTVVSAKFSGDARKTSQQPEYHDQRLSYGSSQDLSGYGVGVRPDRWEVFHRGFYNDETATYQPNNHLIRAEYQKSLTGGYTNKDLEFIIRAAERADGVDVEARNLLDRVEWFSSALVASRKEDIDYATATFQYLDEDVSGFLEDFETKVRVHELNPENLQHKIVEHTMRALSGDERIRDLSLGLTRLSLDPTTILALLKESNSLRVSWDRVAIGGQSLGEFNVDNFTKELIRRIETGRLVPGNTLELFRQPTTLDSPEDAQKYDFLLGEVMYELSAVIDDDSVNHVMFLSELTKEMRLRYGKAHGDVLDFDSRIFRVSPTPETEETDDPEEEADSEPEGTDNPETGEDEPAATEGDDGTPETEETDEPEEVEAQPDETDNPETGEDEPGPGRKGEKWRGRVLKKARGALGRVGTYIGLNEAVERQDFFRELLSRELLSDDLPSAVATLNQSLTKGERLELYGILGDLEYPGLGAIKLMNRKDGECVFTNPPTDAVIDDDYVIKLTGRIEDWFSR